MARNDIRANELLAWNEYKGQPIDTALAAIYRHAEETSRKRCGWYWDSIKTKRHSSLGILFVTLVLLIMGTVLPILAGLGDRPDVRLQFTQYGVAALAFA